MSVMLIDYHRFVHQARVPWPQMPSDQIDWVYGVETVETWLRQNVGHRWHAWAWTDANNPKNLGVAFRQQQDCCFFLLVWSG
jgi:hypothetical protein